MESDGWWPHWAVCVALTLVIMKTIEMLWHVRKFDRVNNSLVAPLTSAVARWRSSGVRDARITSRLIDCRWIWDRSTWPITGAIVRSTRIPLRIRSLFITKVFRWPTLIASLSFASLFLKSSASLTPVLSGVLLISIWTQLVLASQARFKIGALDSVLRRAATIPFSNEPGPPLKNLAPSDLHVVEDLSRVFMKLVAGTAIGYAGVYLAIVRHPAAGESFSGISGPIDALYFSAVTLATVGYGEFHPTTPVGKVLVITNLVADLFLVVNMVAVFAMTASLGREQRRKPRRIRATSPTTPAKLRGRKRASGQP